MQSLLLYNPWIHMYLVYAAAVSIALIFAFLASHDGSPPKTKSIASLRRSQKRIHPFINWRNFYDYASQRSSSKPIGGPRHL
jgi:hypothetical protein